MTARRRAGSEVSAMFPRLLSILIGYVFGCVLTAEIISRKIAGKPVAKIGPTGNPGMANVMDALGFWPGITVLLGDLVKCLIAMVIAALLFSKKAGWIVVLYAGLGCTLGHDFPFWRGFKGGKGVATSSASITIYSFPFSLIAHIAGIAVTLATKYLCLSGPTVPLVFAICMLCKGDWEAAAISAVFTALSVYTNLNSLRGIKTKTTKQNDILGALFKNRAKRR